MSSTFVVLGWGGRSQTARACWLADASRAARETVAAKISGLAAFSAGNQVLASRHRLGRDAQFRRALRRSRARFTVVAERAQTVDAGAVHARGGALVACVAKVRQGLALPENARPERWALRVDGASAAEAHARDAHARAAERAALKAALAGAERLASQGEF